MKIPYAEKLLPSSNRLNQAEKRFDEFAEKYKEIDEGESFEIDNLPEDSASFSSSASKTSEEEFVEPNTERSLLPFQQPKIDLREEARIGLLVKRQLERDQMEETDYYAKVVKWLERHSELVPPEEPRKRRSPSPLFASDTSVDTAAYIRANRPKRSKRVTRTTLVREYYVKERFEEASETLSPMKETKKGTGSGRKKTRRSYRRITSPALSSDEEEVQQRRPPRRRLSLRELEPKEKSSVPVKLDPEDVPIIDLVESSESEIESQIPSSSRLSVKSPAKRRLTLYSPNLERLKELSGHKVTVDHNMIEKALGKDTVARLSDKSFKVELDATKEIICEEQLTESDTSCDDFLQKPPKIPFKLFVIPI